MRNNRTAGNNYERETRKWYERWFPNAVTSRNESRTKDAGKVDIIGIAPLEVQCKYTKNYPNFYELLEEMEVGNNYAVIHHKKNVGKGKGKEEIVVVGIDTWGEIIDMLKGNEII